MVGVFVVGRKETCDGVGDMDGTLRKLCWYIKKKKKEKELVSLILFSTKYQCD